jgi:hypothetical protein
MDAKALACLIRSGPDPIRAVVLTGSWARGEADEDSDVDLAVVWARDHRAIRVGHWVDPDGGHDRLVEAIYLPADGLDHLRARRATMAGARVLYDADGTAAAWLDRQSAVFAGPVPEAPADTAYGRFDMAQLLRNMEAEVTRDPAVSRLLAAHFATRLMEHVFRRHGAWAPTLRRQLPRLHCLDPAAAALVSACLTAPTPQSQAAACRRAWEALADAQALPSFATAPIHPLD